VHDIFRCLKLSWNLTMPYCQCTSWWRTAVQRTALTMKLYMISASGNCALPSQHTMTLISYYLWVFDYENACILQHCSPRIWPPHLLLLREEILIYTYVLTFQFRNYLHCIHLIQLDCVLVIWAKIAPFHGISKSSSVYLITKLHDLNCWNQHQINHK
jgi:hypothetical protein